MLQNIFMVSAQAGSVRQSRTCWREDLCANKNQRGVQHTSVFLVTLPLKEAKHVTCLLEKTTTVVSVVIWTTEAYVLI